MTRSVSYKLVLLGESSVGKSSLVHRYAKDEFDPLKESTIGAAFVTKLYEIPDSDKVVKFEIWDTAGQERYKSLTPMYYRNAKVALVVYDLDDLKTFEKAKYWINELKSYNESNIQIKLVGNKLDLVSSKVVDPNVSSDPETHESAAFSSAQISVFCEENNIESHKTSAKTGEGVEDLFKSIALEIEDSSFKSVGDHGDDFEHINKIDLKNFSKSKKMSCC